ncbi:hypothetical protein M9458_029789 [Cirrhinus mrigala]|uniref:SET domain-containing protein n=1 Tax=Cirrhinus mrigala TaxID=683832 RepID=A0ABD0PM40_CIRMR
MSEWEARTHEPKTNTAVVGVKHHKTSAQQVATFALSAEEEAWFDVYCQHVRPTFLSSKGRKRSYEDVQDQECFFISSTGKPVYNASNDLNRFHEQYVNQHEPLSIQMARKVFETATKCLADTEKSLVADYLTHSTATAEKHYRMRQPQNVAMTRKLLVSMVLLPLWHPCPRTADVCADSIRHPAPLTPSDTGRRSSRKARVLAGVAYAPEAALRVLDKGTDERVSATCPLRVTGWIAKQGWKSNIPTAARILGDWKPPGSVQAAMDSAIIRRLVTSQKWKGLQVADTEGKGKGVIATRPFQIGEVICDFHGCVVTAREGQEVHTGEGEYLFVYTNSAGEPRRIDASSCECHLEKETFGRLLRHSSKCANARPRLYSLQSDGQDKDVILFIAVKAIKPNDELLFDYGNKRKSCRGEGLDLSWV